MNTNENIAAPGSRRVAGHSWDEDRQVVLSTSLNNYYHCYDGNDDDDDGDDDSDDNDGDDY